MSIMQNTKILILIAVTSFSYKSITAYSIGSRFTKSNRIAEKRSSPGNDGRQFLIPVDKNVKCSDFAFPIFSRAFHNVRNHALVMYTMTQVPLSVWADDYELVDLPPPWVPLAFAAGLVVGVGLLTSSLGDVIDDESRLGMQSGARAKKEIERSRSSYFKKKK